MLRKMKTKSSDELVAPSNSTSADRDREEDSQVQRNVGELLIKTLKAQSAKNRAHATVSGD